MSANGKKRTNSAAGSHVRFWTQSRRSHTNVTNTLEPALTYWPGWPDWPGFPTKETATTFRLSSPGIPIFASFLKLLPQKGTYLF